MRTPRFTALATVFFVAIVLAAPLASKAEETSRARREARTVIVVLDAVPYSVVAELKSGRWEGAGDPVFEELRGPVPLISTFPSTTSLALAAILEPFGLEISPGYEARHYDRELDRIHGGGLVSYNRLKFPWRTFFDWKRRSLWLKMIGSLRPVKASLRSIENSLDAFIEADPELDPYFIYYDTTDLAGHLRSPESLKPILVTLDAKLRELRAENPERPFRTVLLSDHGMAGGEPLVNTRRAVFEALEEADFAIGKHLEGEDDVVFVPFGLVSSFVVYARPGRGVAVAGAIAGAEGVDACAAREGEGWWIEGEVGGARIGRRRVGDREEWSYGPVTGDPLGFAPVVERLAARASRAAVSGPRWFSDRDWFEATRGSDYPDALYRVASAFELVENPASVVCSVEPGHMFGAALTDFSSKLSVGRLEWTHGALRREDSWGFLMSDAPLWHAEGAVRFSDALRPFVPAAQASASSTLP